MHLTTYLKFTVISLLASLVRVSGHGRLVEPPARNTLWRFGFKSQANYNDNELFCGGIGAITRNEGKCGICGDPYDGLRLHETGNDMARNETVRNYFPGSSMDLMIEIVANHGGQFNFEICWRDSLDTVETEDCFEGLRLSGRKNNVEDVGDTRGGGGGGGGDGDNGNGSSVVVGAGDADDDGLSYELDASKGTGLFTMSVELPANKTCEHCVFRWHWRSANNWGVCEDGSEAIGCGYQEIYRNCADISIKRSGAGVALRVHSTTTP